MTQGRGGGGGGGAGSEGTVIIAIFRHDESRRRDLFPVTTPGAARLRVFLILQLRWCFPVGASQL